MIRTKRNLYDFDHTIYKGDASLDFILYCLTRNPLTWKRVPGLIAALTKHILGHSSRKEFKQEAFIFLRDLKNVDAVLESFWEKNKVKIAKWYLEIREDSDVIISASPEFLLLPITKQLETKMLIGTRMDIKSGKIYGANCRGEEKLKRLTEVDGTENINKAYSDSLSDLPVLKLAKHPHIVSGNKIIPLQDYKPSKLKVFKSRASLRFLIVGALNASLGVLFSYALTLVIHAPLVAFVLGYSISLLVSYCLNSIFTFLNRSLGVGQFFGFVISYIPNFIIQFILVHVFANTLGLYPLLSYTIAVAVGTPITFFLLANHTFKGGLAR